MTLREWGTLGHDARIIWGDGHQSHLGALAAEGIGVGCEAIPVNSRQIGFDAFHELK